MRLLSFVGAVALVVAAMLAGIVWLGGYDVSARTPHWAITTDLLTLVRDRSIARRAAGFMPPADLDSDARQQQGAVHFVAHCVECHGGPGVRRGDIGRGLTPEPPSLARAASARSPAELFWVVKNGIKMSGMPSWADHGEDELWATVSFLRKLPTISPEEFKAIQAKVAEHPHAGGADHGGHTHQ